MDDSKDKKENVEYYQEILNKHKTIPKEQDTSTSSSGSGESKHATDTDFQLTNSVNSTTETISEDSLPVIKRPKIKYRLRSMTKNDDHLEATSSGEATLKSGDKSEVSDSKISSRQGSVSTEQRLGTSKMRTRQSVTINDDGVKEDFKSGDDKNNNNNNEKEQSKGQGEDKSDISDIGAPMENTETGPSELKASPMFEGDGNNSSKSNVVNAGTKPTKKRKRNEKCEDATQKKPKKTESKDSTSKSEISDNMPKVMTRSRKAAEEKSKGTSNEETKSASEFEEEVNEYFSCKVCSQSFKKHDEYKKHKMSCTNIVKKHFCTKCSKSFSQKSLLNQHFDYRHTNKPKKFICEPCGKSFELKKSLQEHNHRLHDESGQKYLCDFCSRSFWHFGEFTVHWASHTGVKPYTCGRCQKKSFASADRLNKHLDRCGKQNNLECNKCGKGYSHPSSLATHIKDAHHKDTVWKCPFCNKIYQSEGGYYGHLRVVHDISRTGKKLSAALIEKFSEEQKANITMRAKNKQHSEDKSEKKDEVSNSTESASEKESQETDITEDKPGKKSEIGDDGKENNAGNKPMEMSHTCPFPKCNNIVLQNDDAYYKHLWDMHQLGRNK